MKNIVISFTCFHLNHVNIVNLPTFQKNFSPICKYLCYYADLLQVDNDFLFTTGKLRCMFG